MDGKNRAASSYLSPGNPPADKEQNDPLAQVFHNACSYNFLRWRSCCTAWQG